MKTTLKVEEKVVAPWMARIGLWCTLVSLITLGGVLAGDIAVLAFAYKAPSVVLGFLHYGPVAALVLGIIGNFTTWYHWLRVIARWMFRRKTPDFRRESKDIVKDRLAQLPGDADTQLRRHTSQVRRAGQSLSGCRTAVQIAVVLPAVAVTVATFGPVTVQAGSRSIKMPASLFAQGNNGSQVAQRIPPTPTITPHPLTGRIREFSLQTPQSFPDSITSGPDGNVWFTESGGIGKITTNGVITEYPLPGNSRANSITAGPDGNLWFIGVGQVGRITPSGNVQEFPITQPTQQQMNIFDRGPRHHMIAVGPDGNLWFTEYYVDKIGKITTAGKLTEFALPNPTAPDDIVAGPGGSLWFTEDVRGSIGKMTTSGALTQLPLPVSIAPAVGIVQGTDGNLWFTTSPGAVDIGRLSPSGSVTVIPVPGMECGGEDITSGPDGNLWFTEPSSVNGCPAGNVIWRVTPAGVATAISLPNADSSPSGITVGPDDNIWFTEDGNNAIGEID